MKSMKVLKPYIYIYQGFKERGKDLYSISPNSSKRGGNGVSEVILVG